MKPKIYYLALKTILQHKCLLLICRQLGTYNIIDIVFQKIYKEGMKIWYANGFKWYYYPIFVILMVDYKEKFLITGLKNNI